MLILRLDARALARLALLLGLVLLVGACSRTPPASSPDAGSGDSVDRLDNPVWAPKFEPDYNHLHPQPWVEVVTQRQGQTVVVTPDTLIFPREATPEVLSWEPGRIVVSAPSEGTGTNLMGFARRVKSVGSVNSSIVVHTEAAALQDIITGDMQQTLDFSRVKDVDLAKLDLQWAAHHLYVYAEAPSPERATAPADGAAPDSAAKAVARALTDAWQSVTPASFEKSASISKELKASQRAFLFSLEPYTKHFNDSGRVPLELSIKGSGDISVDTTFKPGAQVGMRIPNAGHDGNFAMWMNVDSQLQSNIELDVALEARVTRAGGKRGGELEEALAKRAEWAEEVLNQAREKFLGDPDMKPAGGWKRTLFITKPATQVLMVGPVPVVFTQTFQIDLECGFEAKAEFKAKMAYSQTTVLKFSARYENGKVTESPPLLESRKDKHVEVTGGGSLSVSCGLIPRLNVFVYDSAGLNVGVRGSLVARASYEVRCDPDSPGTTPESEVGLGLYGNFGVQVGGRVQVPGSSYAGKSGQELGFDVGPIEVWSTEADIYSQVWKLEGGLGYCTPPCHGTCGGPLGGCKRCEAGQRCGMNTDCSASAPICDRSTHVCAPLRSSDNILNREEPGIDCGGRCPFESRGASATRCDPARKGCTDKPSLELDLRSPTQSAQLISTRWSTTALPDITHGGDSIPQALRGPADLTHAGESFRGNLPASWQVQSEATGDGKLSLHSSRSDWNQVLTPVFQWDLPK